MTDKNAILEESHHYVGKLGTLAGYKEALRELLILAPEYFEAFDKTLSHIETFEEELANLKEICRGYDKDYAHRSWQLYDREIKIWLPIIALDEETRKELSERSLAKLRPIIKDIQ